MFEIRICCFAMIFLRREILLIIRVGRAALQRNSCSLAWVDAGRVEWIQL